MWNLFQSLLQIMHHIIFNYTKESTQLAFFFKWNLNLNFIPIKQKGQNIIKESKEKELFFEIYDSNVGLTFLISNTYRNNVDLESIGVKGYTTKGKNHGKGLHLAGKIVNNSTDLYTRTIVDSNHFTQKIIIKKE